MNYRISNITPIIEFGEYDLDQLPFIKIYGDILDENGYLGCSIKINYTKMCKFMIVADLIDEAYILAGRPPHFRPVGNKDNRMEDFFYGVVEEIEKNLKHESLDTMYSNLNSSIIVPFGRKVLEKMAKSKKEYDDDYILLETAYDDPDFLLIPSEGKDVDDIYEFIRDMENPHYSIKFNIKDEKGELIDTYFIDIEEADAGLNEESMFSKHEIEIIRSALRIKGKLTGRIVWEKLSKIYHQGNESKED